MVFFLGLVLAIVLPDVRYDDPGVRRKVLITSLQRVRTGLDRYWGDHGASYPSLEGLQALGNPSRSLRSRTDLMAYLDGIPQNPFTQGNSVGPMSAPVGAFDWVYDPGTGLFKANDSEENKAL